MPSQISPLVYSILFSLPTVSFIALAVGDDMQFMSRNITCSTELLTILLGASNLVG